MAAAGQSAEVRVFNAADGTTAIPDVKVDFGGSVGLFFSPDGTRLGVVSGTGDIATVDLFGDTKLGRPVSFDAAWLFSFSPDGRLAAVASAADNSVALIDVGTERVVHELRPAARGAKPFDRPVLAAFSPDGARVAVGSAANGDQPAEIEIFSTADGQSEGRRIQVPGVPLVGEPSDWSPDGVIAGAYHGQVTRVDVASGERLDDLALPGMGTVDGLDYAQDGRLFVAGESVSFLFDRAGQPIETSAFRGHAYLTGSWGPGDTLVLPDYSTGEVRVVDPVTDQPNGAVYAGPPSFTQVTVGSDGRGGLRGVAFTDGKVITLWDVATGLAIGDAIEGPPSGIDALANVNMALTADPQNHRLIIWDLDPAVWRTRACAAAGRNLTREEWKNFLPEGEPYHATCPQYPDGA